MKLLILIVLLFLGTSSQSFASESPILISGFDDVLRQAENTGVIKAAIRLFHDDKTFSGIPQLYSSLTSGESDPKFFIVSAISNMFDGRIEKFLQQKQFPTNRRYLRSWLTEPSIENFKTAKFQEIAKAFPQRKFIIIFDNSDASIHLANALLQSYPDKIQALYLHHIMEKQIPANTIAYDTAFDIALMEFKAGRINSKDLAVVADSILNESQRESLFPSYSVCPKAYNPCNGDLGEIRLLCEKVRDHVQHLCSHS